MSDIIYYVGLRVIDNSQRKLLEYFPESSVKRFHSTLIYSRQWFPYKGDPSIEYIIEPPYKLDIFHNLLVLLYGNAEITARHNSFLVDGANWDYKDFRSHITLGPRVPHDFPTRVPNFPIILTGEYYRTWKDEK